MEYFENWQSKIIDVTLQVPDTCAPTEAQRLDLVEHIKDALDKNAYMQEEIEDLERQIKEFESDREELEQKESLLEVLEDYGFTEPRELHDALRDLEDFKRIMKILDLDDTDDLRDLIDVIDAHGIVDSIQLDSKLSGTV